MDGISSSFLLLFYTSIIILVVKYLSLIRLFTNLTPLIPLSFEGEGEEILEGLRPSKTPIEFIAVLTKLSSRNRIPKKKGLNIWKEE